MAEPRENQQKLNKFLIDPEMELQSHALINQKNSKAMQQYAREILNTTNALKDSLMIQEKIYNSCANLKAQNAANELAKHEKVIQVTSLHKTIKKKENAIKMLEHNVKKSTEEYEKLKAKNAKETQEDHTAIKAYKKAINAFTKYFGYTIAMSGTSQEKSYCAIITFIFNARESKYPIKFVFHKETDSLLSFDAGTLISAQQQAILLERYKTTNNNGALFCTLRNIALKKHVL